MIRSTGLCFCSYLILYKSVRPLCFLMYDIRPTVSTTADNFGTEISPSIDCHKCPLTSLGVGLGLGEGRPGFLWLYSLQRVCRWCKLFSFPLCNSTPSFAAKCYAAPVWSDDLFSLCWVMYRLGEVVGLSVWHFVVSDPATWCFNSHSESMRTLWSCKAQQCKHQLHSTVWTVGKVCPLQTHSHNCLKTGFSKHCIVEL